MTEETYSESDKEYEAECPICERGLDRTNFTIIIGRALARKHNLSLRLCYLQIVNVLVHRSSSPIYLHFLEQTVYEMPKRCIKKYYMKQKALSQAITISSNVEKAKPKIYLIEYRRMLSRWNLKKEKLVRKREEIKSKYRK